MSERSNVLVVCDAGRGRLSPAARELLTLARTLADQLAGTVDLLALGTKASAVWIPPCAPWR